MPELLPVVVSALVAGFVGALLESRRHRTPRTVWLVGRYQRDGLSPFDVLGCYSTLERAVARCTDRRDFVGPLPLDLPMPDDVESWPGAFYPVRNRILPPPASEILTRNAPPSESP